MRAQSTFQYILVLASSTYYCKNTRTQALTQGIHPEALTTRHSPPATHTSHHTGTQHAGTHGGSHVTRTHRREMRSFSLSVCDTWHQTKRTELQSVLARVGGCRAKRILRLWSDPPARRARTNLTWYLPHFLTSTGVLSSVRTQNELLSVPTERTQKLNYNLQQE